MTRMYRGYEIRTYRYQGCLNYIVPALRSLGAFDIAATLATARKWIDCAIASGELKR